MSQVYALFYVDAVVPAVGPATVPAVMVALSSARSVCPQCVPAVCARSVGPQCGAAVFLCPQLWLPAVVPAVVPAVGPAVWGRSFFVRFYRKNAGFGTRTDRAAAVFSHPNPARKPPKWAAS